VRQTAGAALFDIFVALYELRLGPEGLRRPGARRAQPVAGGRRSRGLSCDRDSWGPGEGSEEGGRLPALRAFGARGSALQDGVAGGGEGDEGQGPRAPGGDPMKKVMWLAVVALVLLLVGACSSDAPGVPAPGLFCSGPANGCSCLCLIPNGCGWYCPPPEGQEVLCPGEAPAGCDRAQCLCSAAGCVYLCELSDGGAADGEAGL
jgi:hypothetical protein